MSIAHINGKKIQTIKEHCENVSKISARKNDVFCLNKTVEIIGYLHDIGKYTEEFQKYIKTSDLKLRGTVKHSVAGGLMCEKIIKDSKSGLSSVSSLVKELISNIVMCHHGLDDYVSPDGEVRYNTRIEKFRKDYDANKVCEKFISEQMTEENFKKMFSESCKEIEGLLQKLLSVCALSDKRRTESDYYINIVSRYLLSLLIDADSVDTENFMSGRSKTSDGLCEETSANTWKNLNRKLEEKLSKFSDESEINKLRAKISDDCFKMAQISKGSGNVYRLSVPTGLGKTLSSFRYAFTSAEISSKKHIFYIAPFNSILEQNAAEIRKIVGKENILEHHCNIVKETEEENDAYNHKVKSWDSPIIATSAVQFLNCLFSKKRCDIQRFHTLGNSVIIIDEVQALPIKCTYIFNLAINFLSKICGSDVIFCSATQPPFDNLAHGIKDVHEITDVGQEYFRINPRVKLIEENNIVNDESEFITFLNNKINKNALIIVNTKKCAFKLYKALCESNMTSDYKIFHLSTNMCAKHRVDKLDELREALKSNEKIICISTQLIEAGVDISFETVVRSKSGMDSIVQAAGRCNRSGEYEAGNLYIIDFNENLENISALDDIKMGKSATENILFCYSKEPEKYDNNLFSAKLMKRYYNEYFYCRRNEMSYSIKDEVSGLSSSIVELLSVNTEDCRSKMKKQHLNVYMCQAPKTAGEYFKAIDNGEKFDFIVQYEGSKDLVCELYAENSFEDKMKALKKLQLYTVSLYGNEFGDINKCDTISFENFEVRIIKPEYYDFQTGVTQESRNFETAIY